MRQANHFSVPFKCTFISNAFFKFFRRWPINAAFRLVPYLYIHVWPMSFRHSIRNFDKGLMGKMSRSPDFVKICQITLFLNRIKASWKNQCLSSSNYERRLNVVFVTFQFLPNGGNAINVLWSIYLKSVYFDRQYRIWLGKPVHV